jgi:hypothetical protein
MNLAKLLFGSLKKSLGLCVLLGSSIFASIEKAPDGPHYYCTAVDEAYFARLVNLIGSIHKNDFDNLGMIAVFDLGMTEEQSALLNTMQKVTIYQVEKKNADILTPFKTHPHGWKKRGWFSWKPVVIKQSLDMFPYVLYVDAGTTILQPLTDLFKHIRQNGYFLLDTGHNIEQRITQPVIEKLLSEMSSADQTMILDKNTMELDGGCQGLSSAVYLDYVLPMYNLASDLTLFMDDGSARLGFGEGRHDQILFSIYANKLGYKFFLHGWTMLRVDAKDVAFHTHWNGKEINESTSIYRSRCDINTSYYEKYIHLRD